MIRMIQSILKSVFDIAVAFGGLLFLAPLFILIAVVIKLEDGGPVFFRQERLGKNANPFLIWKFRSMVPNADDLLLNDGKGVAGRITRIGRFLRRFSLDEVPQLINVICGEVSLVGPRAVLPSHFDRYNETQKRRFLVRPGITGLAQVSGRNTLPWSRRLELDVLYVATFSLALDVRILLQTVRVVFMGDGFVEDRNPQVVDDLPHRKENT